MPDVATKLVTCFQNVFPDLPEAQVMTASQESLPAWDSVASITLANLIEEEFQVEVDFDDWADLNSFDRIRQYLDQRASAVAGE